MHRHLTAVCVLSILILGILTLGFGTHAKRNFYTMQSASPINVALATNGAVASASSVQVFTIPVYFHIIADDSNGAGNVEESRLDEQIQILNNAFYGPTVGANIQFFFWKAGVTRHDNHDWFIMEKNSVAENDAKRSLRQGGANALNFYTTRGGTPSQGPWRTGWAWLAEEYASNPCRDGVVVPFTSLPRDSTPNNPFNNGDLPVHEVGHWLGLYHTYHDPLERNVCTFVDDKVDDTPAHLDKSIGGCPTDQAPDTCTEPPPTYNFNFMTNYSDVCKTKFTRGPFERMLGEYLHHRQSSTPPSCPIPAYEGWVDVADCNSIIGWAADRNRPNASITVSIYDGDNRIATIPASELRTDVGHYLGDNGQHGFAIATPQAFKDARPHTLRVKFEHSTFQLNSGTRTLSCSTYYEIVARHSGKCLDVEGESMAAGARIIQFVCGGWKNQHWRIIPVGGEYYKIVARHSGKVLDVQGGGLTNGTPVWQWNENGTPAQQWKIIDVGGGYKRIMARHSGKALDVEGGFTADLTQVHQWDYVGFANQQWRLRPVP